MKTFLTTILAISAVFSLSTLDAQEKITNESISEISERLESLSNDQLLDRRSYLINALQESNEEGDTNSQSRANMLLELSIVEQLLILGGVVLLDNITEDSSTPPDTVFPVITINGDNPATVELGGT